MKKEAHIFKAFSEELRLRLMLLLLHGELCVQDLVNITGIAQSTISRHLAYLSKEGLVRMRGEHAQSIYCVNRSEDFFVSSLLNLLENSFSDYSIVRRDLAKFRSFLFNRAKEKRAKGKIKVLFVCQHNSARSQIAEAYAKKFGEDCLIAESAGIEPSVINPLVAEVLREDGIKLAGFRSKNIKDIISKGKKFDYVITVCSESENIACQISGKNLRHLHWRFDDPARLRGSERYKLSLIRGLRDKIKKEIQDLISTIKKE